MVDSADGKITNAAIETILKHYPKSASVSLAKMRIIKFKETIKELSSHDTVITEMFSIGW